MKKILILILSFSILSFGHERHKEIVPQLDKVLVENLIGILEKKDLKSDEVLEKDALAIDWITWLFGALSLDTEQGNDKLTQSLKAINYHINDKEDRLFFWEKDMRYIVNVVDLMQHSFDKKECGENILTKSLKTNDYEKIEKCYYFLEIEHNVRDEDKKLLQSFLSRINILINKARGK